MVQKLMAYDTENATSQDTAKLLAEVKDKLAALESDDSQKKTGSSKDK